MKRPCVAKCLNCSRVRQLDDLDDLQTDRDPHMSEPCIGCEEA